MAKPNVAATQVVKYTNHTPTLHHDLLAVEEPMEIRLGFGALDMREQKSVAVTMRTPGNDFELAVGFLLSEGIIQGYEQLLKVQYCTDLNTKENTENIVRVELKPNVGVDLSKLQRNFYATSSCGICGKESIESVKLNCALQTNPTPIHLDSSLITQLPNTLRNSQTIFEHTGGIHACALFTSNGDLLLLREDVGRHNALDKLIGAALYQTEIALHESILLLSGRASFELIQKAAMAGIPIVCAVGAPSSLAVETATAFNITLIGFLREHRFNVYHQSSNVSIN